MTPMPAGATDTHFHVFGPSARYPYAHERAYTPEEAAPEAATAMFRRLGIGRAVLIQATVYGFDNSRHLDAAAEIGIPARVVVIVPFDTPEQELMRLHNRGARGIRFVLAHEGGLSASDLERFSHRLKAMGWHIDLMAKPEQLVENESLLRKLACPVVIDHLGMVRPEFGLEQPAFRTVERLVRDGNCWVKISGAYRISKQAPRYADAGTFVRALVAARSDRLFWGSDWPHPLIDGPAPDALDLLECLHDWVPEEATRNRILADNPAQFYGF